MIIVLAQFYALGGIITGLVRAHMDRDDSMLAMFANYLFWPLVLFAEVSDMVRRRG